VRSYSVFLMTLAGVWLIDQGIKELFLSGFGLYGGCISLELHMNRGVAFSLFASLGEWLKWVQVLLIGGMLLYFHREGSLKSHPLVTGALAGGALGNLYDRFAHGAVVDYIYWHCGFDFAVFNFADVIIDFSVVSLLWLLWREGDEKR